MNRNYSEITLLMRMDVMLSSIRSTTLGSPKFITLHVNFALTFATLMFGAAKAHYGGMSDQKSFRNGK